MMDLIPGKAIAGGIRRDELSVCEFLDNIKAIALNYSKNVVT
jgi:hypothetical protein